MTPFETAIKNYLDARAASDAQFAEVYAKPNKSFDECIKFIYSEVKKANKKNERCVGYKDEDIYCLAIHYYDEDGIVVSDEKAEGVTASYVSEAAKKVELTDAEKEEARRMAVQNEAERIRRKMQDDADRRKKAAAERAKIARETEAQSELLFTFDD